MVVVVAEMKSGLMVHYKFLMSKVALFVGARAAWRDQSTHIDMQIKS